MATQAEVKPEVKPQPQIVALHVDAIQPNKTNRKLTEQAIREMETSIRLFGVMEPVAVRREGEAWELIFGECRWRGAKKAGLSEIPAVVLTVTPEEAQAMQIAENLKRTNPTPLEEAESYGRMRKLLGKKGTIEEIAGQIASSPAYVAQRLKLLDLIPAAQELLRSETISLGHALLLAPLNEKQQKAATDWVIEDQTAVSPLSPSGRRVRFAAPVAELRIWIEREFMLALDKAPFDVNDAKLYPKMGACPACPHNTANAGQLFPDVKGAVCTLPECFFEKRRRTVDIQVAELQKKREAEGAKDKVFRLGIGSAYHNEGTAKVQVDGYLAQGSWDSGVRTVKPGDECKDTRTAVLVYKEPNTAVRAEVGAQTLICTSNDCAKHRKSQEARSGAGTKPALSGKELVKHKEELLAESLGQRLRWATYKALCEKLLTMEPKPAKAQQELIEIAATRAMHHLFHDNTRDAGKALGLQKARDDKGRLPQMDWRSELAEYFRGKPFGYLMATLAAEDIRSEHKKAGDSDLFRIAAIYKVDFGKLRSQIATTDKEQIAAMAKRANLREKQPKAKKAAKKKAVKK